ncbi:ketoacyl-ACP synthase III family protein [Streptomyces sp. AV19]|uniref:ketoacyl-ACP synthase III family protein n=1 Tax=Streptomyces sp. AV19 TaxID=2793068 RepID=UPI0018FE96CB|nr:ketoacyl-ACP synthase III family protein [Streptomyces sp. AV19]MBH1934904.1 ketoacyl-ACP synthase III family protein [Streptomyces sp. AV19]MDG4537039.1 ketoacyl-ACP synthase III family protein [Streptomyces sp. AV19]
MRWDELYIAGTGTALPGRITAARAVAEGRYPREWWEQGGMISVCAADDGQTPLDLALVAARRALDGSGLRPDDVGLLLHSSVLSALPEMWNPVNALQRRLAVPGDAFASEVRAASDGGMASLELAAAHLAVRPPGPLALLTAGDIWPASRINRWNYRPAVFGDGAAALVLSRAEGFARVLATTTSSDPELEGMSRGDEPIRPPGPPGDVIDLDRRAHEFMAEFGRERLFERFTRGTTRTVHAVLADAGLGVDDIDRVITINACQDRLRTLLRDIAPQWGLDRSLWLFGRTVGHLGPADQFAGLDHLRRSGATRPGQHVLLLSMGLGWLCTCAVIRIL